MSRRDQDHVLRLEGITKRFGDLVANDRISLSLRRGEVLGLLGENGSGKTTLMSILFGHYLADEGTIEAFGRPLPPGSPRSAIEAGIGMVHQHFTLADNLTVLDNVMLGSESLWRLRSDRAGATRKLEALSARFGLAVDPSARIGDLAVGERQRVEILKALYRDARILILDEPTAVLTPQETESLFETLAQMSEQGLALIFISHKLDEVVSACHRVVVLRGGRVVGELPATDTSRERLAELIVGHELPAVTRRPVAPGEPILELRDVDLQADGRCLLASVNLTIRAREIVGVVGVSGNGQGPLAQLAGGSLTPSSGCSLLFGEPLARSNAVRDSAGRIGRIPDDRHALGMIPDMAVWENAILDTAHRRRFAWLGALRRSAAIAFTKTLIERFDIRCRGPMAATGLLSGGNIQKLILGRIFSLDPRFIIANQPTRGLDVGASAFVQERLLEARETGAAILLISEDLDEVFALADRIAVIYRGRLTAPKPAGDLTIREIGLLMAGEWREAGHAH